MAQAAEALKADTRTLPEFDGNALGHVGGSTLLASALDGTALCSTDLRKRLPKHERLAVRRNRNGDGYTDDDIWPERLEPGDQTGCDENRPLAIRSFLEHSHVDRRLMSSVRCRQRRAKQ